MILASVPHMDIVAFVMGAFLAIAGILFVALAVSRGGPMWEINLGKSWFGVDRTRVISDIDKYISVARLRYGLAGVVFLAGAILMLLIGFALEGSPSTAHGKRKLTLIQPGTGNGGRSSTPVYFIAASDATTAEKTGATATCTGTNDQTVWLTADTAVATNGGIVQLSSGHFTFGASATFEHAIFIGQGNSATYVYCSTYTISWHSPSNFHDMLLDFRTGTTNDCVRMESIDGKPVWSFVDKVGDGLSISNANADHTRTGLALYAQSSTATDKHISLNQFGKMKFYGLNYGIKATASKTGAGLVYINENDFDASTFESCKYSIDYAGGTTTAMGLNSHRGVLMDMYSGSLGGIICEGAGCIDNVFTNILDMDNSGGIPAVWCKTGSSGNRASGFITYFTDVDNSNYINRDNLTPQVQEHYSGIMDSSTDFATSTWLYQSFTVRKSHYLSSVRLPLAKTGVNGVATFDIYLCDANTIPAGSALATTALALDNATASLPTAMWTQVNFATGVWVRAGSCYAIVCHSSTASMVTIWGYWSGALMTNGTAGSSSDTGSTFSRLDITTHTFGFEEWGN